VRLFNYMARTRLMSSLRISILKAGMTVTTTSPHFLKEPLCYTSLYSQPHSR
jgi:hypothetical protein